MQNDDSVDAKIVGLGGYGLRGVWVKYGWRELTVAVLSTKIDG